MNRAFPAAAEMLHCLQTPGNLTGNNGGGDMTVLERQRAHHLKWQQHEEAEQPTTQSCYFTESLFNHLLPLPLPSNFDHHHHHQGFINNESMMMRELARRAMKTDPGLENNGWTEFGKYTAVPPPATGLVGGDDQTMGFASSGGFRTSSVEMSDFSLSRTASCAPAVGNVIPAVVVVEEKSREMSSTTGKMGPAIGRESSKKRKAAQNHPKVSLTEDPREKRIKGDTEEVESKITDQKNNRETSAEDTSKETSKISEVQKPDYIHVRARRGQATDSHSLAERVRREKISERMKYLQDLVPGCNKITGKAGMLDEIINYVQSLQRQVEFLSMKLATVNPRLDFNVESFLAKDMLPVCSSGFPIEIAPEMANCSPYLHFNQVQQVASSCGLDMVINPSDMAVLRRTTSAPVTAPDAFLDTSCFTQEQQPSSTTWENDFQNLYGLEFHQGRPTEFPTQPFTGSMEANTLKMEI